MPHLVFAYPGNIDTPTGGYGYDRRVIAGLRELGWTVDLLPLGDGFPFPAPETLKNAQTKLEQLPAGTLLIVDGLALGVMDEAARAIEDQLALVALVHHPLCQENGLGSEMAQSLLESERKALSHARHVIVTSPATATQVVELFGIPKEKLSVILPGTERVAPVRRIPSDTVRLLSVGTVVPRKGYDLLFEAFSELNGKQWHLDIVGGLDADPDCYRSLQAQASALGIDGRITFHGAAAPEVLADFYRRADVFVLASRYEGYGMAYTEALSHGLPVIGSGAGAVKDTLPDGASIYCGVEDVALLREALDLLITDNAKRSSMANAAEAAAASLPTWSDAAERFAAVLSEAKP